MVRKELFEADAERNLFDILQQVSPLAQDQFEKGAYTESLKSLAVLREKIDHFFSDVMVNAENVDVKNNRLALLQNLHSAMNKVADISKLDV